MNEEEYNENVPSFASWAQDHKSETNFFEVEGLLKNIADGYDLTADDWQNLDLIFVQSNKAETVVKLLKEFLKNAIDEEFMDDDSQQVVIDSTKPLLAQGWFIEFMKKFRDTTDLISVAREFDEAVRQVPKQDQINVRTASYQFISNACVQGEIADVIYAVKRAKDIVAKRNSNVTEADDVIDAVPGKRAGLLTQKIVGPVPVWMLALTVILVVVGLVVWWVWPENEPEMVALPFGAYPMVGATEVVGEAGQKLPDFAPVTEEAIFLPTDIPEPTRTPEPTATAIIPTSSVGLGCPDGYRGWSVFPKLEYVGQGQGFETLDFEEDPEGPVLEDKKYFVLPIVGRDEKVIVVMKGGSYFMPMAWFQIEGDPVCLAATDLKSVQAAYNRLEAQGSYATTIWSGEFWTTIAAILIVMVICVQLFEFFRGKAVAPVILLPATFWLVMYAYEGIDAEHSWSLFVLGVITTLGLGIWENRKLVEEIIRKAIPANTWPAYLEALFEGGFLRAVNWSPSAVWATLMIAAELVVKDGSPLRPLGETWAIVIAGVFMVLFYALDTIKRSNTTDIVLMVTSAVLALCAGGATALARAGSSVQIIAYLITVSIGVTSISIFTRPKDETEYNRILDNLGFFFALCLLVIALVVRLGLVFKPL